MSKGGKNKMIKDRLEIIKSKFTGRDDKRKIENVIVLIIILIITAIIINTIWNNNKTNDNEEESSSYKVLADKISNDNEENNESDELEEKLENILSKMDGVGKVSVMITYSQSSEIVPVENETTKTSSTEESDSDGGTRKIEEVDISKEIIYSSKDEIVTKTVINPIIQGAIVIADGASDVNIKTNIISAVEAITGLSTYRIQVFEMN
jgi:stage III sporulation protein AG